MVKTILSFIGYTAAIALSGVIVLLLTQSFVPKNGQLTGLPAVLTIASVVLIYGSPIISGSLLSRKRRRKIKQQLEFEAAEAAKREVEATLAAQQDALKRRYFERERLIDSVEKHKVALRRNLERAVHKNDYGAVVSDGRSEALHEFFQSIELNFQTIDLGEAYEVVIEQLAMYDNQTRMAGFDTGSIPFDGVAFERWVADGLAVFGWLAEVTKASGDQGIDVIAVKNGHKIGLQCKLYSSAIGNKAVQEAYAGMAYHGVDKVAVLSNASFTSSARSLASATGVLLLSHHDIPLLYEKAFPN